jgi:hypothetical protein
VTVEVIERFVNLGQPVLMTIKRTRLVHDTVTATLARIDGKCVVTSEGKWYRMNRITSIARADALDGVKA